MFYSKFKTSDSIMRIFACLFLTIFCFSLSIQAQGDKPNKKIQNLERELLEFNLDIQYLNSEDGKVLVDTVFI